MKKLLILLTLVFCASALAQYNPLKPPPFRLLIEDTNWVRKFTKMSNYARTSSGTGEYWRNGDTLFFNFNGFVQKILLGDTPDSGDVWKYNGVVWRALPDEGVAGGPSDTAIFAWKSDTSSVALMSLEALHSIFSDTALFAWKADSSSVSFYSDTSFFALHGGDESSIPYSHTGHLYLRDDAIFSQLNGVDIVDGTIDKLKLDPNDTVQVSALDGYQCVFEGNKRIKAGNFTNSINDTTPGSGYLVTQHQTQGENLVNRLPIRGTAKTVTNPQISVDEHYNILNISSGTAGGGIEYSIEGTFSGTSQRLAIYNTQFDDGDVLGITYNMSVEFYPTSGDIISARSKEDSAIITRPTDGTSDLKIVVFKVGETQTFNPLAVIDSGATIRQWYSLMKETEPVDDSILTFTDWSLNSNNIASSGIRYAKWTTGGPNNRACAVFTGRIDSSAYSIAKDFTWMHGTGKTWTLVVVVQPDSMPYYPLSSNFMMYDGVGAYYSRLCTYKRTLNTWDFSMYLRDINNGNADDFSAAYIDTTGYYGATGSKPVIIIAEFDTCNGVTTSTTSKLYVNSTTYSYRDVNLGDTTGAGIQLFTLGAWFTYGDTPTNFMAGKLYQAFGIEGIMTRSDLTWLVEKLDAIYDTKYGD